jgi:hypothetical protein
MGQAVPLAALALMTACGGCGGNTHPCTEMYAPAGIRVEAHPELANRVADATLTACWNGTCHKRALRLRENGAEARASQTPEPGPWPGFAVVRDLPGKPIRVTLEFKNQRGATVLDRRIRITPRLTYPNGRDCSPGGRQARLTVTEEGSLQRL